jgi:16S rRNA (guanine966-N2)-methyltransferase
VRITGGEWASRRVTGPGSGAALRPTPDALREQAFAVLAPEVAGAVFLDLFAGTGINSLEALSRGAAAAMLVDRAPASVALIRRNFSALAVPRERFEIVARDAQRAAPLLAARGVSAAVAWCDPPFSAWEEGPAALALARELGVLTAHAAVVLEAPPKVSPAVDGFEVVRALHGAFLLRLTSSLRNRFV